MPLLLTHQDLKSLVDEGELIANGSHKSIEGLKYDFRLGSSFLKAHFGRPMNFEELSGSDKAKAVIEPGEVVFVLTEESVKLPDDVMIVLSHKRKISHDGISILGGFCVDPGYEGYLLIGMHNFSSETFVLEPGRKLIAGLLYRLHEDEGRISPKPDPIWSFPDDLVRMIKTYQPINLNNINDSVSTLRSELENLKADLRDDRKWREDIKSTIDRLVEGLDKEIQAREGQYNAIQDRIGTIETARAEARGAWRIAEAIFMLLFGAVVTVLVGYFFGWITPS